MIRKATIKDAKQIQSLINFFAAKNLMLSKSLAEIYENIRDFWVCEKNKKIVGCCNIHIIGWDNLAEIKSLAVAKKNQKRGIATTLINKCIEESKALNIKNIFTLTYIPNFFRKFGFRRVSKSKLPHKIWSECSRCPKFPDCKEEAMIKKI